MMARVGLTAAGVVDAAAALADADGLEQLSLARVAAALGVRPPSLYAHVDGLEDLRRRLAARGAQRMYEAVAPLAAGRSGTDALRAVADGYRGFALTHPGLYAAARRAGTSGDAAAAAGARFVELMRAVLRGYGLEGEAVVHGVRTVRAALDGFITLSLEGGFGLPTPVADSWEWMLVALDRGLSAGPPAGVARVAGGSLTA